MSASKQEEIRNRVRRIEFIGEPGTRSTLATLKDAEALCALLSDPDVHAPIYSLPSVFDIGTVSDFIAQHQAERERGEGLLFLRRNSSNEIIGFSAVQVWPQWAAGELAGALRPDRQSKGEGAAGAKKTFNWMFTMLGLDVICATAALDNVRTEKLLTTLGFEFKGTVQSQRPNGTKRLSKAWEISCPNWQGC